MQKNDNGTSNATSSLRFPFLGSLESGEVFEYLLLSIEGDSAKLAILPWFTNRQQLHVGDKIDLFLPYILTAEYNLRGNISGNVVLTEYSDEISGDIYRISFSKEIDPLAHPRSFDQFTKELPSTLSLINLLCHLIKDSIILKAGIEVYLKHLFPYFSRIGGYSPEEFTQLKTYFLQDVATLLKNNKDKLEKLYEIAHQKISKTEQIPVYIDLEDLRITLESEISLSVFNVIFSMKRKINVQELFIINKHEFGIHMYIRAIKNLEKRLYSNYNHIVIIYLKSLALSEDN